MHAAAASAGAVFLWRFGGGEGGAEVAGDAAEQCCWLLDLTATGGRQVRARHRLHTKKCLLRRRRAKGSKSAGACGLLATSACALCMHVAGGWSHWARCCNTICDMKPPGDTLTQSVFVTGLAGGQPVAGGKRPSGRPCLWALHACGRAASCACLGRAAAIQTAGARNDW